MATLDEATDKDTAWPITTVALDRRVDLAALVPAATWRELRRYAYGITYAIDAQGSVDVVLHVFACGAAVCEGIERFGPALRLDIEAATGRSFLTRTEETYTIAVDPERAEVSTRVAWDRVVIPERRNELVSAVALLLGQSAALERYEIEADSIIERTLALSRELAQHGRLPRSLNALVGRIGKMFEDRLELARWFFLVDRPEATWENPRVAQLFDALFANLELRQRHDAILHKLGAAEHVTQMAIDLWHGRRSNALEWAIVILIVIEIVFAFAGILH
ncbi:MAG TPA: RMD1 family protein [Planctomycetota bacterium]|nr:RMD1 family protein [Planctomycetota bacterium]